MESIENSVSSSSAGPATLANNLSLKTTSSDNIPSLTYAQAFAFGFCTSPGVSNCNSAALLVPHSSSAAHINAWPWLQISWIGGC